MKPRVRRRLGPSTSTAATRTGAAGAVPTTLAVVLRCVPEDNDGSLDYLIIQGVQGDIFPMSATNFIEGGFGTLRTSSDLQTTFDLLVYFEKMVAKFSRYNILIETVEKPKKHNFKVYNYLILIHVKFGKMPKLGFFDSLAIYPICCEWVQRL